MSRSTLAVLTALAVLVLTAVSLSAVAQVEGGAPVEVPGTLTVPAPSGESVTLMTPEALLASWGLGPYPGGTLCLLSPDTQELFGDALRPYVACVTDDTLADIKEWASGLDGWSLQQEAEQNGVPFLAVGSPERPDMAVIAWGADDAAARVIVMADGSYPSERAKQARKAEDIRAINDACWIYENDTGTVPKSVADLMVPVGQGPPGYNGPYLRGENEPTDPFTGEPYELTDGVVSGPGDVTTFLN